MSLDLSDLLLAGAVYAFLLLLVLGLGKAASDGDKRLQREANRRETR